MIQSFLFLSNKLSAKGWDRVSKLLKKKKDSAFCWSLKKVRASKLQQEKGLRNHLVLSVRKVAVQLISFYLLESVVLITCLRFCWHCNKIFGKKEKQSTVPRNRVRVRFQFFLSKKSRFRDSVRLGSPVETDDNLKDMSQESASQVRLLKTNWISRRKCGQFSNKFKNRPKMSLNLSTVY